MSLESKDSLVHNKPDTMGLQTHILIFTLGIFADILMEVMSLLPVPKFLFFEGSSSFVNLSNLTFQIDNSFGNE